MGVRRGPASEAERGGKVGKDATFAANLLQT